MKKKLLILVLLGIGVALTVIAIDWLSTGALLRGFDTSVAKLELNYRRWFRQQDTGNFLALVGLSFAGGLVSSISPCILSLLPINLSYIGTREITSRWDAFAKAGAFVLGVVTVLSLFGVFSSMAGFVLVQFPGYFQVGVGIIIVLMGLSLAGIIHLPLPPNLFSGVSGTEPTNSPNEEGTAKKEGNPKKFFSVPKLVRSLLTGPYGVGLTFALVSSPCTSPIMVAVLTATATTGSQLQSALAMVSYSLGYTAIIFFASLFAGLAKQTRVLLTHSETITRIASISLLLVGGFYLVNGGRWIFSSLKF